MENSNNDSKKEETKSSPENKNEEIKNVKDDTGPISPEDLQTLPLLNFMILQA